jgi:hypothetical protein
MGAVMGLLELIERAINEHGSAAIMRERLDLIREQAQVLQKQILYLQEENSTLIKRVAELERQAATKKALEEFVECRGALFKRKPDGTYHQAVFCPICRAPMCSLQQMMPYLCRCGITVDFTGCDLRAVMAELPKT